MDTLAHNFQSLGLIFDVAGIAILGVPAIFRMKSEVAAQMGTYWNYNLPLARARSISRVDITAGPILLILGFAFQIAASLEFRPLAYTGPTALGTLVLFFIFYWSWLRGACTKWLVAEALKLHEAGQTRAKADQAGSASS